MGTGASAIQFVPQIQPLAATLTLFQRTAPWVMPRSDAPISVRTRTAMRTVPGLQKAARARVFALREAKLAAFRHPALMTIGEREGRAHLAHAITDPDVRRRFHFGSSLTSDWTPGSGYALTHDGVDGPLVDGTNLVVEPPRLLVQSFTALWSEEVTAQGTTRVTWQIEPVADSCRLTVVHDQLPAGANAELYGGWPMILSGLKTLIETGELLTTPGSLMYAQGGAGDQVPR